MDDDVDVSQRIANRLWVGKVGRDHIEAVVFGLLPQSMRIAPGENDVDPIFLGEPHDQIAGVTVGPVDENLGRHGALVPPLGGPCDSGAEVG